MTAPGTSSAEFQASFYEAVGGHETFQRLVAAFYRRVAVDPVLRPLYPEADLGPAEERMRLFLEQYWGGPRTYSDTRGHPRLRMRHAPFAIGPTERDSWVAAMAGALAELDDATIPPAHRAALWDYFLMAADAMMNS